MKSSFIKFFSGLRDFHNDLIRNSSSRTEGIVLLVITYVSILTVIVYMTLKIREDISNPCVEYETDVVCSGVGDSYECYEEYFCIGREND